MPGQRTYLCIDLKSFYASVECVERGLDPLTANLVVADPDRTEKTICLAVSPSLKALGVKNRCRVFEIPQDIPFITARPRMRLYMEYSARIYGIYLRYAAPEDIHVYSIDEVFLDITGYLAASGLSPREMAQKILLDVFNSTGITATAGIGTNLYLAKVAMDIVAKRLPPDERGARIAQLDELGYRRALWDHRPLTDFWRVGRGYARKLEAYGLYTMGDIARCSLAPPGAWHSQELLFRLFGVNAELLIDHAWGWENCTLRDIKAYRPDTHSLGSGQVLPRPYPVEQARVVAREMADQLALDLLEQGRVTDQIALTVGYDRTSLDTPRGRAACRGPVVRDRHGRAVPEHAHGTQHLSIPTASARAILEAATELFDRIVQPGLLVRRLSLTACRVLPEGEAGPGGAEQLDLFSDPEEQVRRRSEEEAGQARERRRQEAVLEIRRKYGKNAILKGLNFQEGATGQTRNRQIGGHRA